MLGVNLVIRQDSDSVTSVCQARSWALKRSLAEPVHLGEASQEGPRGRASHKCIPARAKTCHLPAFKDLVPVAHLVRFSNMSYKKMKGWKHTHTHTVK